VVEESLSDSFVHYDESHGRSLESFVVDIINGFLKLRNLLLDHLWSHSIPNSISVDNEMVWVAVEPRPFGVDFQGFLESLNELVTDDFLEPLLDDALREVLRQLFVVRSAETNDRLLARVTHVDTYQHGVLRNLLWNFQGIEVSTKLRVDLFE
jgi:hypothetical protein